MASSYTLALLFLCTSASLATQTFAVTIQSWQIPVLKDIQKNLALTGWTYKSSQCSAYKGLTCDSNGFIIGITLSGMKLTGVISPSFGKLYKLRSIDLSGNMIRGILPAHFGELTSLSYLDLSNNILTSEIPLSGARFLLKVKGFQNISTLTHLNLANNSFYGDLGNDLGLVIESNTKLTYINLGDNYFFGSLPSGLTALKTMTVFDISNNDVMGAVPAGLFSIKTLIKLSLGGNMLSIGSFPSAIFGLSKLSYLDLSACAIQDKLTTAAAAFFSKLAHLNLKDNQLYGPFPLLPTLPNHFDVSNNAFSGPLPTAKSMSSPMFYDVSYNYFTGSGDLTIGGKTTCPKTIGTAGYNCLSAGGSCALEVGRTKSECAAFCSTGGKMCGGHGVCLLNGMSKVPTCACVAGFKTDPTDYASCIASKSSKVSPPPALPTVVNTRKTMKVTPKAIFPAKINYLGDNARHLSRGFTVDAKGVPKWYVSPSVSWTSSKLIQQSIRDEGGCVASWAIAPTVALSTIFSQNRFTIPDEWSAQSIIDCVTQLGWCTSGSPYDALNFMATAQNFTYWKGGVPNAVGYPFLGLTASEGRCKLPFDTFGIYAVNAVKIAYFEQTKFEGWLGLLLAAANHPVVAFVQADSTSFQSYGGGYVYDDPSCFTVQVNQAVLIIGYDLSGGKPFFLIRNSWGGDWGESGRMKLAIRGGFGICGINTRPGLYPVVKPNVLQQVSICDERLGYSYKPCGGGTCTAPVATGIYNCSACPPKFAVTSNNIDHQQNCRLIDVCTIGAYNPCGVGACANDGEGSYTCTCPTGYAVGVRADSSVTCVPSTTAPKCAAFYSVHGSDTCPSIAATVGITQAQLEAMNPGACSSLKTGSQLCIAKGSSFTPNCAKYVPSLPESTCAGLAMAAPMPLSTIELLRLNPGLHCSQLTPNLLTSNSSILPTPGSEVCVEEAPQNPVCPFLYKAVQAADDCAKITADYFRSKPQLTAALNGGWVCNNERLYVGQKFCSANWWGASA